MNEFDPWEEQRRMRRYIRRMMNRFTEPIGRAWSYAPEYWERFKEDMKFDSFPIDLSEKENELILKADLPGFKKDDVGIRLQDNILCIIAQKKKEVKEVKGNYYRQERSFGALRRCVTLPVEVDADSVDAEFKDGILTLRMKKKKVKKGKEIKIK